MYKKSMGLSNMLGKINSDSILVGLGLLAMTCSMVSNFFGIEKQCCFFRRGLVLVFVT